MNIKKVSIRIFVALLALIAAVLIINSFDEELRPEVRTALAWQADALPDENNLFYALIGLHAALDHDVFRMGQLISEAHEKHYRQYGPVPMFDPESVPGARALELVVDGHELCAVSADTRCLADYRENADWYRRTLADNRLLLSRYRALYGYPAYGEPWLMAWSIPSYANVFRLQRLAHAAIGLQWLEGETRQASDALSRDIRLWRRMLAGSRTLLSKMIALAHVSRDIGLFVEMYDSRPADRHLRTAFQDAFAAPFSTEERNFRDVMTTELQVTAELFSRDPLDDRDPGWSHYADLAWQFFLLKENASLNDLYDSHMAAAELSELPDTAYAAGRETYRQRYEDSGFGWDMIYNPAGKLLSRMGAEPFPRYIAEIRAIDGRLRLLRLKTRIHAKAICGEDIPGFLATSAPPLRNPFTGRPMSWDPTENLLFFDVPDSDADRVQVNLVPEPKCIASDSSARVRCKPKTSAIC